MRKTKTILSAGIMMALLGIIMIGGCSKKDENAGKPVACYSLYGEKVALFSTNFVAWCSEDATSYHWDFGDGTTADGEDVNHAYATPGTYTFKLTVTNAKGSNSKTGTVSISINPLSKFTGVYHDLGTGTCNIGTPLPGYDFNVVVGPRGSGEDWGYDYGYHLDFLRTDNGQLDRRVRIEEKDLNEAIVYFSDLTPYSKHYNMDGSFRGDSMVWKSNHDFIDGDPFTPDPATITCTGVSLRH